MDGFKVKLKHDMRSKGKNERKKIVKLPKLNDVAVAGKRRNLKYIRVMILERLVCVCVCFLNFFNNFSLCIRPKRIECNPKLVFIIQHIQNRL